MEDNLTVYEDLTADGPIGWVPAQVSEALEALKGKEDHIQALLDAEAGEHRAPWLPDGVDTAMSALIERSLTNMLGLIVDASAQVLKVDNFRRAGEDLVSASSRAPSMNLVRGIRRRLAREAVAGGVSGEAEDASGEADWAHWRGSRLEAGHLAVIRCALITGAAYMVTERRGDREFSRGLSPKRTICLFEDPATDIDPVAALHVVRWPDGDTPGVLAWWDTRDVYRATFRNQGKGAAADGNGEKWSFSVEQHRPHGASVCPVSRITVYRDLEGGCIGIIEPLLVLQDRLNQTVADLLVAQSYAATEVRTVSGQAPPMMMRLSPDGVAEPVLDDSGNPIPAQQVVNVRRWLYSEDPNVKYGSIPGADLKPLIEAVELAMRHISAIAQVPPHYLLGEIANVSADGLMAASIGLDRKNEELATLLGEGLERVFRVAADMRGDFDASSGEDYGEVMWADRSNQSIGAVADALGKFAQMLQVPARGLWELVPGVTKGQLESWRRLWLEEREARLGFGEVLGEDDFLDFEPQGAATPFNSPPEDVPSWAQ